MQSLKSVARRVQLQEQDNGKGFRGSNLGEQLGTLDPFLTLGDFWMPQPFFPPHPHAGFSVMTYMHLDSEGAFINRDSRGDHSRIEPGAVHWTQAGSGIQHEEIPEVPGQACHGLQMWVNHAAKDRLIAPKAMHMSRQEVPEITRDGGLIRVIAGEHMGKKAPQNPLPDITLLDVHLPPDRTFTHPVADGHISFVMVLRGEAAFDERQTTLGKLMCARFSDEGSAVWVATGNQPVSFLLATGKPFNEPTVFGGPFVMTTSQQLREAQVRYSRGEFGALSPSPVFYQ